MFSPDLTRFIIDPENISEEFNNTASSMENPILKFNYNSDYEKIISDCNFFSRIFERFSKTINVVSVKN
jgi:hypothetical protein